MTATLHHSTEGYEREADETRRRLSNSLDELADNLTPGRMLDEVLNYAKAGGANFLKGLGNAASINPIPSLLIAAGAVMFLSGKGRLDTSARGSNGESSEPPREASINGGPRIRTTMPSNGGGTGRQGVVSAAAGAAGSIVSSAASAIGAVASGAARAVRSGASAVGDAAGAAADAAGEGTTSTLSAVRGVVSTAADLAADAAGTVVEGAREAGEKIGALAESAGDTAVEGAVFVRDRSLNLANDLTNRVGILIREQPLVFAAAGLAMGVAIAAALPRTKAEDEFMGDTSDAVKETVAQIATAEFEHDRDTAVRVVEEIKDVAVKEGLTASGAADAVRELGDKLKTVITTGGEAVASAVDDLAGQKKENSDMRA